MTVFISHHRHPLSPDYISGFADGEGCFSISFSHKKKMPFGICVTPSFSISQNKESVSVLYEIQAYFHCGFLRSDRNTFKYEVRSVSDLTRTIRPHFETYPLLTQKQQDFLLFCEVCDLVLDGHAKTASGLRTIIELSYKMNACGKNRRTPPHVWLEKCSVPSLKQEGE
jgi:hypothetical protein